MNLSRSALAAIAAAMLFLLRNPSKFKWTDSDDCLIGWAVRLKTGKGLFTLAAETGQSIESAAAEILEMSFDNLSELMYATSPGSQKQIRNTVRSTVLSAIDLIVGGHPRDYYTALFATIRVFLTKPSSLHYDQDDVDMCIIAHAARAFKPDFVSDGNGVMYKKLFGVDGDDFLNLYWPKRWPGVFLNRLHSFKATARPRDRARNVGRLVVERTLHLIATGK